MINSRGIVFRVGGRVAAIHWDCGWCWLPSIYWDYREWSWHLGCVLVEVIADSPEILFEIFRSAIDDSHPN